MKKKIIHTIILARGGSKGIKNKNLLKINKKPLVYWSIISSLNTKEINYTWVSSDNIKILKVSEKFGALPILRPSIYANDNASSESAWKHAINYIEKKNIKVDIIVGIQPTSPIRDKNDLKKALYHFKKKKYDSLLSGNITNDTNIWVKKKNKLIANYNFKKRRMRQQEKIKILENGSFYIFDKNKFIKSNCRLFGKIGYFLIKKYCSFQIDDLDDVKIIKKLIRK